MVQGSMRYSDGKSQERNRYLPGDARIVDEIIENQRENDYQGHRDAGKATRGVEYLRLRGRHMRTLAKSQYLL